MKKYPPTAKQFSAYMKKHSLTLRMVAELVGVSKPAVSLWKSGVHQIPYSSWFTLRSKVEGEPPD